jgi:hypothetical protein
MNQSKVAIMLIFIGGLDQAVYLCPVSWYTVSN